MKRYVFDVNYTDLASRHKIFKRFSVVSKTNLCAWRECVIYMNDVLDNKLHELNEISLVRSEEL